MENLNPLRGTSPEDKTADTLFVVGKGFHMVGTVRGAGVCVVDGTVDGALETEDVKINPGGFVSGDLKCNRLDIAGRVQGTVEAQDLILRERALVEGKVHYTTIAMESGAIVDGELRCTKVKPARNEPLYFFKLPENIRALITESNSVELRLGDGRLLPPWISLQDTGVSIDRVKFQEHLKSGGTPELSLRIDGQEFSVSIP